MIRKLSEGDRENVKDILIDTNNFNEEEIKTAVELIDIYIKDKHQKDYEIFVDTIDTIDAIDTMVTIGKNENEIGGYVCIGPRPLTLGTYDLYWIAVNPKIQSRGIGSGLIKFIENYLKTKEGRLILIETSGKQSYEKERKFYEKNLYSELVNIKDFYSVGDSLVVYGKYLI